MQPIKQITLLLVLLVQVLVLGAGDSINDSGTGPIGEARVLPEREWSDGGPVLKVLPAHDYTGELVAAQDADGLSMSMVEGPLDAPCDNDLPNLTDDLGSNPELDEFFKNTLEGVKAWEVLDLLQKNSLASNPSILQSMLKSLKTAEDLGVNMKEIEKAAGGSKVFKPKSRLDNPTDEIRMGDEVAEEMGDDIVLAKNANEEGIDGFYLTNGRPIQLKTITSASDPAGKVVSRAKDAYEKAKNSSKGWNDVDVRIEVKGATKSEVYSRWVDKNRIPTYDKPVDGTITTIKVHCSDGIIELPLSF